MRFQSKPAKPQDLHKVPKAARVTENTAHSSNFPKLDGSSNSPCRDEDLLLFVGTLQQQQQGRAAAVDSSVSGVEAMGDAHTGMGAEGAHMHR